MLYRQGLILTVFSLFVVSTLMATTTSNPSTTIQKMNRIPLSFTKNMGQWDERVLFRATAGGTTMWFTKEGVTYQFTRQVDTRSGAVSAPGVSVGRTFLSDPGQAGMPILPGDRYEKDSVEQLVLTAKFVGANPRPEIIAEGQMEYKCNYFLGNDPTKWHTDVPNYEAIMLKDIYPGIDLKYSGDGSGQAAYEFIVAPGADIAQIKVAYEGAEETSIDADGKLILQTKWGDMIASLKTPADGAWSGSCAWWTSSSTTSPQDLAHGDVRQARQVDGFEASVANRQALSTLAVVLSYSTYLGGGSMDWGTGIAVDGSGCAYVRGTTYSYDFPIQNPYQSTHQPVYADVFVAKLSSTGNSLIYSTYLGGGDEDDGKGIAVDSGGSAYVTGTTNSSDFPTWNPYQTYQGYDDVFVTKLSSSGNSLIYSTYLGGGSNDYGEDIAVDGGSAYVTGQTWSSNFPTLNPYQATLRGGYDAFVTKLSSTGNSLIYGTYLGGSDHDRGYAIAVDGSGNAYVAGNTESSNFPTLNPFQVTLQGGYDAFVTKLSSTGASLIYSTYLGGGSIDDGNGIAVDGSGNAYVTGYTWSSDFPTLNPYQTDQGGYDAFVTKLSGNGSGLIYSTYLGGENIDEGCGIAVDGNGNAYVTGWTRSSNFPTQKPYQTHQDTTDVFVTKLNSSGGSLIYSTYLGGGDADRGSAIAVDGSGNAYVTGATWSFNFPTQNPFQTHQYQYDAFVTKLSWAPDYSCGDANSDEQVDLLDAVFLINYIFVGGPTPQPLSLGDVDCSGSINIADAVRLIIYIFAGGPAPCEGC